MIGALGVDGEGPWDLLHGFSRLRGSGLRVQFGVQAPDPTVA